MAVAVRRTGCGNGEGSLSSGPERDGFLGGRTGRKGLGAGEERKWRRASLESRSGKAGPHCNVWDSTRWQVSGRSLGRAGSAQQARPGGQSAPKAGLPLLPPLSPSPEGRGQASSAEKGYDGSRRLTRRKRTKRTDVQGHTQRTALLQTCLFY